MSRKPTKAQQAFLQTVYEGTVAAVESTQVTRSARGGTHISLHQAIMLVDSQGHGYGKPFSFAMVCRCEAAGWLKVVDGILKLTELGEKQFAELDVGAGGQS